MHWLNRKRTDKSTILKSDMVNGWGITEQLSKSYHPIGGSNTEVTIWERLYKSNTSNPYNTYQVCLQIEGHNGVYRIFSNYYGKETRDKNYSEKLFNRVVNKLIRIDNKA